MRPFEIFIALFLALLLEKPTVSIERATDTSRGIVVVTPAEAKSTYQVIEVLFDGGKFGLKKEAPITVDLKGMVYDSGQN